MNLLSKETTYRMTAAELETALIEMVRSKGLATPEQKVSVSFEIRDRMTTLVNIPCIASPT